MNTISELVEESGLSPAHAAEVLGIKYDTLLSIFKGKFKPSEGLLGDAIQMAEDVKMCESEYKATPDSFLKRFAEVSYEYRLMKQALQNVENNS